MMLKRCGKAFVFSAFFGMLCNFLIEVIVRIVFGGAYLPVTPEYLGMFPSQSLAYEVDFLLYGVIGIAFSTMTFVFDINRIGFVVQNLIYYTVTGIVWIPIVIFIWQLQRYPEAIICVIIGFVLTNLLMTILAYRKMKKDILLINQVLE